MSLGQLEVVNAIGMRLLVAVTDEADAYAQMRALGKRGWTPGGPLPAGGLVLPYAMADTFDFALIGARPFEIKDGADVTHCLEHRGLVYTRREFPAKTGRIKMPAKIKYSRGAKPTDEPHLKEGAEGDKPGYVTLITFVGGGPAIAELTKPRPGAAPGREPALDRSRTRGEAMMAARSIDELLSQIMLPTRRMILGKAKFKKLSEPRLRVLIGSLAGANTPLAHADAQRLIELIDAEKAA